MTTCTICWRICRRCVSAFAPIALGAVLLAQSAGDGWKTYHGDDTGQRHSPLTQLTPSNVHQMTLVWAFATGDTAAIKATPIVSDGIVYLTTPDNVWAIDARSAHQLWRYTYPANEGFHIGHRGVAVYKNFVYFTTPDAHLVALDAHTGTVKWNVVIADAKKGYWSTNAPLLIRNHVIVGVAGDFDNLPGILTSVDPETGATQWVFYSTPPPGTAGNPSDGATGGQMWMTGTFDPQLNLLFVGTGNPTPVLNGVARAGDNRWTDSIVAINPDTGKLAWGFQATRHDTHDWDAAEVPVLIDAPFNGTPAKLLLQASRNGYFYVLDRGTGRSLLTKPFATVNWASGIDQDGRPIPNPAKEPARDGRLVAPDESGGTNYRSPSFDPDSGLLIVSAHDAYGIYFYRPDHGAYGWAGADYGVHGTSVLRAIDYHTGAIKWNHLLGEGAAGAGVLTTASGLTFTGDTAGNVLGLRTADGATLWHSAIGRVGNSPITYELDGRQFVVMAGGSSLYAWALPEQPVVTAGPRNDLPQPYVTTRDWGELPAGVKWAAVTAIEPAPDGSIFVIHRCFANSCSGRSEAPILQYNAAGKLQQSWGAGLFVFPHGATVDRDGNLWVTDARGENGKGHQVLKFDRNGRMVMTLGKAGVSGSGPALFDQPTDVAVAPNGDIFVTDSHRNGTNNRVVRFRKDGTFVKEWGHKGSGRGEMSEPHSIAIDSQGRLFVADRENNRIVIFDQDGTQLDEWRQFGRPSGIFITADDTLYVADSESGPDTGAHELPGIKKGIRIGSARNGQVTAFIEDSESTTPDHSGAEGVGVDAAGNVYGGVVRRQMLERHTKTPR